MATDDALIRTLVIVLAVILLLPFLVMALAMPPDGRLGEAVTCGTAGCGTALAPRGCGCSW